MISDGFVTIGLIGMPAIEEKRLQAAFEFSKGRHTSYVDKDLETPPDVLMVNADEPKSLIEWRATEIS